MHRSGAQGTVWRVLVLAAVLFALALPLRAAAPDCETLAAEAGRRAGLPDGLLPAIARIESGRTMGKLRRAWPWTLNHAGRGLYFESQDQAMAYLRKATQGGRANIDIGCMQINHYWHSQAFEGRDPLARMMDPATNVAYAVDFLLDLHARHGSWPEAVRHYHSPDPVRGARYLKSFTQAQALILRAPDPPAPVAAQLAGLGAAPAGLPAGAPSRGHLAAGLGRAGLFGTANPQGALLLAGDDAPILPDRAEADALYAALIDLAETRARSLSGPDQAVPVGGGRDIAWLSLGMAAGTQPRPNASMSFPRLNQR